MTDSFMPCVSWRVDAGLWWPDYDHKPTKCYEFVKKNLPVIDLCNRFVGKFELAIQAGGHAGLFARKLAVRYKRVIAFEPEENLQECARRNCAELRNVEIRPEALSDKVGSVMMVPHPSAGSWRVDANEGIYEYPCLTIDSLQLPTVSAIVLDIEGHEPQALLGAKDTIRRNKPVIVVEMLPRAEKEISAIMADYHYRRAGALGRDAIYVHA